MWIPVWLITIIIVFFVLKWLCEIFNIEPSIFLATLFGKIFGEKYPKIK